jgi:pseudouridine synthase
MIKQGRVTVDGAVVEHPGTMVDPARASVTVDGRTIEASAERVYVLLHKPAGYLSTRSDPRGRKTIMDLLDPKLAKTVHPVGRLDRDASGLMLLTNDGDLTNRLLHPRYHVPRAYEVEVKGCPDPETLRRLASGIELSDGPTLPARIRVHRSRRGASVLKITLREGRKNQVKRMFEAVGHPVRSLRRVSFGPLHLGHTPPGEVRALREGEVRALREAVRLGNGNADPDEVDASGEGVVPKGGEHAL